MLVILERSLWALSLLAILACGGFCAIWGIPSTVPASDMHAKAVNEKDFKKVLNAEQKKAYASAPAVALMGPDGKPKKAKKKPVKKTRIVNRAIYERVNNFNRAYQEKNRASSEVVDFGDGNYGLKIFDIDNTSVLGKIGFEENDVILGIDGSGLDFKELSKAKNIYQAKELYDKFRSKMDGGEPIYIDVDRGGQRVQLWFHVGDQ